MLLVLQYSVESSCRDKHKTWISGFNFTFILNINISPQISNVNVTTHTRSEWVFIPLYWLAYVRGRCVCFCFKLWDLILRSQASRRRASREATHECSWPETGCLIGHAALIGWRGQQAVPPCLLPCSKWFWLDPWLWLLTTTSGLTPCSGTQFLTSSLTLSAGLRLWSPALTLAPSF